MALVSKWTENTASALSASTVWTGNSVGNVTATKAVAYDDCCAIASIDYRQLAERKDEEINRLEKQIANMRKEKTNKIPTITRVEVIKENKVIAVHFSDGTKEKAVCDKEDTFSLEAGIEVCVMKKMMGGNAAYNKYVKNAVKLYNDDLDRKNKEAAEEERKKAKAQKEKERRQRRRERKKAEEIAEKIRIQKEAYILAMKEIEKQLH